MAAGRARTGTLPGPCAGLRQRRQSWQEGLRQHDLGLPEVQPVLALPDQRRAWPHVESSKI